MIGGPRGADDLEGVVGRFNAEPNLIFSEQVVTCSAELCTGATNQSNAILDHSEGGVDSTAMFSKRSAAVVCPSILETNVAVFFKVVPTRSARVIAVDVARCKQEIDR